MGRGWVKKERGSVWEIAIVKLRMWETKIEGIILWNWWLMWHDRSRWAILIANP